MRPAARIQAAIDILDLVEEGIASKGLPADAIVANYYRSRRYIGSKDRRAISELVYAVLRQRGRHIWRLETAGLDFSARALMFSHLALNDRDSLALFGDEAPHSPAALTDIETSALDMMHDNLVDAPMSAVLEVPACVEKQLRERFADTLADAMSALNEGAPLDLRSNPTRPDFDINKSLKEVDQNIEKTVFSPIGFRSRSKVNITGHGLYRDGLIEIQDESAQVASYLVDAKPGMSVVDLCAGGGGKSLLVSALMENRGQVYAFDVSSKRLSAMKPRIQRAGCRNIQSRVLPEGGEGCQKLLADFRGKADRVIIDAPCTGSGTWRRNPDQRWRLTTLAIEEYATLQASLLAEGSGLVKAGGRLVYMTCSLLPDENEAVVDQFLASAHGTWHLLDYTSVWQQVLASAPPETASLNPKCLQLVPHKHQTDGFFVAIFEKASL